MKNLFVIALLLAFTSCQKKDSTPKNEADESNITADVLSKVASPIEYRNHESSLQISKNGDFKLSYDGLIQKYLPGSKTFEKSEGRCLINFEGKLKFFRSPGVLPAVPLFTQARMHMTFARVEKASAIHQNTSSSNVDELCHEFANAVFDQGEFSQSLASYDGMAILFAGIYFDVKNNDKQTKDETHYTFRSQITTGDINDYDVIRDSYLYTYFVTNAGDYDITSMAFNDLKGDFKELKASADSGDLKPMEINVGMYKEFRTLRVTQSDCKIDLEFTIMNVMATNHGVKMKLLTPFNSGTDSDIPACIELREKLKSLGSVNRIAYANQTKNDGPDNYLKLYIKLPDQSIWPLSFKSKK